jgi:hypothetical protein
MSNKKGYFPSGKKRGRPFNPESKRQIQLHGRRSELPLGPTMPTQRETFTREEMLAFAEFVRMSKHVLPTTEELRMFETKML